MGLFKKNNKWWIDLYFNGKRIRKPISSSKKEAEKILIKLKSDIILKKHSLPNNQKIKFVDFAIRFLKEYSRPFKRSFKSDESQLKKLVEHFGDSYLDEISSMIVEDYRRKRSMEKTFSTNKYVSKATINREVALLRSILNKAVEWDILSFNHITKIRMFKEEPKENILSINELNILVNTAKNPLKNIILVAINTGMRKGEILNFKWNEVNFDKSYLNVIKTKSGKPR